MSELSLKTKIYMFAVYICGLFVLVWQLVHTRIENPWMLLALCIAGALGSIFKVEGATKRSHYTISFLTYGFAFAALGMTAALVVVAVSILAEWIWHRGRWYIQIFNLTSYILVMYAAGLVYVAINPQNNIHAGITILGITAAMATFTLLNHLMVGIIVWLARGESFANSGIFDVLPLIMDMTLLCLGASMQIVWNQNPFALALFLLPLYLIYSTLRVPALERQTEIDSKTGLFNHGYFMQQVESELKRANRFDRPMSIIMCDLDLLRNINNTYGHLAGDEVSIRLAGVFKEAVREYDVIARFGGEEFAILMPETGVERAFERAESIRRMIEQTAFVVSTSITPITVTISVGVAGRDAFDQPSVQIIHNADTALYHAKLKGRNRTYVCADETYASFMPEPEEGVVPGPAGAGVPTEIASQPNYGAADVQRVRRSEPDAAPEAGDAAVPTMPKRQAGGHKAGTRAVNLYIAAVAVVALLAWALVTRAAPMQLGRYTGPDWLSLVTFAAFVVITEWFSIELYVKNTTVSTSAVPILAGALIFGAFGALVLAATFAVTAFIKYRSPISRLFFNLGNQLLAAMIYTGLIALTGKAVMEFSVPIQLGICLAASFIVYLITTLLVSIGISMDVGQSALKVWQEQYGWLVTSYAGMGLVAYALIFGYKNDHFLGIILMVVPLVLLRLSQKQYVDRTCKMVSELHEKQRTLEVSSEQIRALNNGLLDTLAEVIDLGDPYVLGHSMRVADLATQIASRLGLHEKQVELIRSASMLHDIGKLGISSAILSKPAKLTPDEYTAVKKHVTLGAELLAKSRPLQPLAPIIGCHHEHYDGRGYPAGKKGNDIPLEARIIAASDAIETMASDRPYSKRMPTAKIVEELERCSGTQFDPLVVEAAIAVLVARAGDVETLPAAMMMRLSKRPVENT